MSFFRRGRSTKTPDAHSDPAESSSSRAKISLSSGSDKKKAERSASRVAQEEAETRLNVAHEELRLCKETLAMRQAEHKTRMELLQIQLEALQTMAANVKGGAGGQPTTVVGYFQV